LGILCYCQLRLMIVEMDQTFIWQSKLVGKRQRRHREGVAVCHKQKWRGAKENRGQFHQQFMTRFFEWSVFWSFSIITVWLSNFLAQGNWHKEIGAKTARKMLVKMTTGVNLTNSLWATALVQVYVGFGGIHHCVYAA